MYFRIARNFACSTIALVASTSPAIAQTLLPPGHVWEYTFTDPTADPTWNTATGVGGIWSLGEAPFGSVTGGDPNFNFVTQWGPDGSDGDDLWVRTALDLTGIELASVGWDLGVDNGFKLYANGNLVGSGNAEGFTYRWEYSGDFSGTLAAGQNVLAVALEDHGFATGFDMQVTVLPEPATVALLGIAVIGSFGLKRYRAPQRGRDEGPELLLAE